MSNKKHESRIWRHMGGEGLMRFGCPPRDFEVGSFGQLEQ